MYNECTLETYKHVLFPHRYKYSKKIQMSGFFKDARETYSFYTFIILRFVLILLSNIKSYFKFDLLYPIITYFTILQTVLFLFFFYFSIFQKLK